MPDPAYRVKHFTFGKYKRPSLDSILSEIKSQPYSLTNKGKQADLIAKSKSFIYVIEVRLEAGIRTYCLGYKFQAADVKLETGKFKKYKIISASKPVGMYLDKPEEIKGSADNWLRKPMQGMPEIDPSVILALDEMFALTGKPF